MTRNPLPQFWWSRATHTKEFPIPAKPGVLFAQPMGKTQCFLHWHIYLQRHRHFFQGGCQTISWACLASTWTLSRGLCKKYPPLCQGRGSLSDSVSGCCGTLIFLSCFSPILGPTQAWLAGGVAAAAPGLRLRAKAWGNGQCGREAFSAWRTSAFFKIRMPREVAMGLDIILPSWLKTTWRADKSHQPWEKKGNEWIVIEYKPMSFYALCCKNDLSFFFQGLTELTDALI